VNYDALFGDSGSGLGDSRLGCVKVAPLGAASSQLVRDESPEAQADAQAIAEGQHVLNVLDQVFAKAEQAKPQQQELVETSKRVPVRFPDEIVTVDRKPAGGLGLVAAGAAALLLLGGRKKGRAAARGRRRGRRR